MGRALALDIGEKTIGIALSDESGSFALPGKTLLRQAGKRKDAAEVCRIAKENDVSEIVVGLPVMLNGSHGIQAEKAEDFVATLRNYVRVPIHFQDERLSTAEAERALLASGRSRQERKQVVDSIAASLFLQTYLDRKRGKALGETTP